MGLDLVPTGNNPPDEINVIIEIPKDAEPVKYEVDTATPSGRRITLWRSTSSARWRTRSSSLSTDGSASARRTT